MRTRWGRDTRNSCRQGCVRPGPQVVWIWAGQAGSRVARLREKRRQKRSSGWPALCLEEGEAERGLGEATGDVVGAQHAWSGSGFPSARNGKTRREGVSGETPLGVCFRKLMLAAVLGVGLGGMWGVAGTALVAGCVAWRRWGGQAGYGPWVLIQVDPLTLCGRDRNKTTAPQRGTWEPQAEGSGTAGCHSGLQHPSRPAEN